jgi:hypothetical protein
MQVARGVTSLKVSFDFFNQEKTIYFNAEWEPIKIDSSANSEYKITSIDEVEKRFYDIRNEEGNISHKIFLCQARKIYKIFLPYTGSDCIEIFDADIESYVKLNLYDHHTQSTLCINYSSSCYIGDIGLKNKSYYGMILFNNGDIYQGGFLNNKKHGYGEYIYSNGDIYQGNWQNDVKEGYGVYKWNNGDIYDGYFHKNTKNGRGKYIWQSGNIYEGEWVNSIRRDLDTKTDDKINAQMKKTTNEVLSVSSVN